MHLFALYSEQRQSTVENFTGCITAIAGKTTPNELSIYFEIKTQFFKNSDSMSILTQ